MHDPMEGFFDRLRSVFGTLQEVEIARQVGVSQATVNRWKSGENTPDAASVGKLCRSLSPH